VAVGLSPSFGVPPNRHRLNFSTGSSDIRHSEKGAFGLTEQLQLPALDVLHKTYMLTIILRNLLRILLQNNPAIQTAL
jgi:hypothetical protein